MHTPPPRRTAARWLVTLVGVVIASPLLAQPGKDKDPLSWDRNIGGMFSRYCYSCHAAGDPSGNVDLQSDRDVRRIVENRAKWLRVLTMLESGQMPPEGEREVGDENRALMIDFLQQTLANIDCQSVEDPGKPTLRRLNRTEYNNVLADLTGLQLTPADDFPPDPVAYGFDNVGDALALPPAQVEHYHRTARNVVDQLLRTSGHRWHDALSSLQSRPQAQQLFTQFATAAFRHPVDDEYVERLLQIYDLAGHRGQAAAAAAGHALTAILISPNFLMRVEREPPGAAEVFPVTDYDLANRLSFFLWSRGPDVELLELAEAGQLHAEPVLRTQVARMLQDPRSQALVDNFFFQWLGLRELSAHEANPEVFPEYDPQLREDMLGEVRRLLTELVQHRRPLSELLDSRSGFVSRRLAQHYALDVEALAADAGWKLDTAFARVEFPDRTRGGLVTTAAFLTVLSDPGRTNIPRRGNFIAGQLLGDAPPPPPPGIPPLETAADGQVRSLRETFELHRQHDECSSCHAKIDPLGFALENYDGLGRYRTHEHGLPIDASAEIAGSPPFSGASGLKDYLLDRRQQVFKTMATKLLIYALGRGLQASDECVVQAMLEPSADEELTFERMVAQVVTSLPFTHRRSLGY